MRKLSTFLKLGWLSYLIVSASILVIYGSNLSAYTVSIIIASMLVVFFGVPLLRFLLESQVSKDNKSIKTFWKILRIGFIITAVITIVSLVLYFLQ